MTAPDKETLAAALWAWPRSPEGRERCTEHHGSHTYRHECPRCTADALLVGPLATPAAPPGPEGEAVERVRAWLAESENWDFADALEHTYGPERGEPDGMDPGYWFYCFRNDLSDLLDSVAPLRSGNEYLGQRVRDLTAELASASEALEVDQRYALELEEQRDAARDLAFRAAFAPEEGEETLWGVEWTGPAGTGVTPFDSEQEAREAAAVASGPGGPGESYVVVCYTASPWRRA